MTNKLLLFIALVSVLLFTACKKEKLTGENEKLIGNWTSIMTHGETGGCGTFIEHPENPNFELILEAKGKYKLFQEGERIEKGKLIKVDGNITFKSNQNSETLDGRSILKFNVDTLHIDRNLCDDAYVYTMIKDQ